MQKIKFVERNHDQSLFLESAPEAALFSREFTSRLSAPLGQFAALRVGRVEVDPL